MLSQDRSAPKAVGFVAHLSEANCFVTDCAQLSPAVFILQVWPDTKTCQWESPRTPPLLPKPIWSTAYSRAGRGLVLLFLLGTSLGLWGGFFSPSHFIAKGNLEILLFFCRQCKLSLAFQHSSGMLLSPPPLRPVLFVVKSPCRSVLSVFYCSLPRECFAGTWVRPSL